jgi:tetratricopeptide (TPR) repeat protein
MLLESVRTLNTWLRFGFPSIRSWKFLLSLLLIAGSWMVCTTTARAQSSDSVEANGKISGTVLSQGDNKPVTQVAINLKSHSAGVFRSVLTDYEGHFEVPGLAPGTYEISVEESGYQPVHTKALLDGSYLKLVLYLMSSTGSQARPESYTVSVRDLKISDKAHEEYNKGLLSLAKKDLVASLNHFTKAVKAFPEYYEAFYHMGVVQTSLGKLGDAMQAFQKSIDLSGGRYAWAQFGLGYALYLEDKTSEAESVIRRGLEVDGNSPDGHAILGMVLLRLDRTDEAEKSAREALLRKPDFAEAYLVLSDAYGRKREYREQLQDLETYLKLEPNGPSSERARQAREMALKILAEPLPN